MSYIKKKCNNIHNMQNSKKLFIALVVFMTQEKSDEYSI